MFYKVFIIRLLERFYYVKAALGTAWELHDSSYSSGYFLFASILNHAITIYQCYNAMMLTSQASVFAFFTIPHSIIPGRNVNLAGCEVSLFPFTQVCHHRDKKFCWPWMAMFIPKHHLSECFFCLCAFFVAKGCVRRTSEYRSRLPEKTFVWVYIIVVRCCNPHSHTFSGMGTFQNVTWL